MLNQVSTSHTSPKADQFAFLRRVTEDDGFRATLEADPQTAMAAFGLHVDAKQIPSRVTLPDAEGILDILIDAEDDGSSDGARGDSSMWFGFISP